MKRFLLIAIALAALLPAPISAQRSGASIDRFFIPPQVAFIFRDTKGRALASQTVNTSIRNLVLITVGQSLCENIAPTAYTPANPTKIDNLNIYDGAIYVAADPLLGAGYPNTGGVAYLGPGNFSLRVADTLITNNKFDRAILPSACIGGSAVADWAPGGSQAMVFSVIMNRLASLGIVAGTNVTIAAIWAQGTTDAINGTSQSAYTNSLNAFITASRAAGFNGLWFINTESYTGSTTVAAIQNAQAAVVNHGANVWAGANEDALVGSVCSGVACRAFDGLHWSDAGSTSFAANMVTALGLSGAPFNFLMQRDLNPANDNDHTPVFLNKAA